MTNSYLFKQQPLATPPYLYKRQQQPAFQQQQQELPPTPSSSALSFLVTDQQSIAGM